MSHYCIFFHSAKIFPTFLGEGGFEPVTPTLNTALGPICAKMIGGGQPLLPEIVGQTDRVGAKSSIFDLFSLVAPQP